MFNDTIAAISTAPGVGAIGIIRVSGDDAINIVSTIFKGKNLNTVDTHTIHYGHIHFKNELVDEVLVSVLKAPRTFTRENTVEIQCHGGSYVVNKVLETCLKAGARLADPGEFTKRAFLNGRIDLTQAEAVMDIIEAKTQMSLDNAHNNLNGKANELIVNLREDLISAIADIEVNIDYPEYDELNDVSHNVVKPKINTLISKIKDIIAVSNTGKIVREGLNVAIIGKPNVGKSSLLNTLMEEDKAIVTDIAGTTRDIVEGQITLGGLLLNIIDTAGIRETEDVVEGIGVEKSRGLINKADVILLLINASEELSKEDKELLELTNGKNRIIILNKTDLNTKVSLDTNHIEFSTKTGKGLETLKEQLISLSGIVNIKDKTYLSNTRHIAKLHDALVALEDAIIAIDDELPIDMVNIDLHNAWNTLGEIIGETAKDGVLDELFSKFCLGK